MVAARPTRPKGWTKDCGSPYLGMAAAGPEPLRNPLTACPERLRARAQA